MAGMLPVTALTLSAAVVCGTALALLARLKLQLARRELFNAPGPERRLPLWALNLALVPLMLLAGLLCDVVGVRLVLLTGSLALALALIALSAPASPGRAVSAVLAAALGGAFLMTGSVVLMPHALFGRDELAASLHVGTVFFAFGALLSATLADILFRAADRRRALLLLGLLCLAPAFFAALAGNVPGPTGAQWASLADSLDLWLAGLLLFLYAPLEASISLWVAAYLTEGPDDGPRRGAWLLPLFWCLFLGSRLLIGLLGHAGLLGDAHAGWLLVGPAVLVVVLLGNLAGVGKAHAAPWVLAVGFAMGPIFSSLLAMVFLMPGLQRAQAPGAAYGALFAAGSAGSALLAPFLMPGPQGSPQSAMRVPLALALLLAGTALAFWLVAT
jgi:fucose permease